jgi:hypothetical protein
LTGGQFFDLDSVNPQQIIDNVLSPPLPSSVLPATDPVFHMHLEIIPSIGKRGPQYRITGRLSKVGQTKLEISCTLEGASVQTKTYFLDSTSASESGVVVISWARMHLGTLLSEPLRLERNIVDVSTRFGIETPLTKIQFLDNASDFLHYDLAPPSERMFTLQEVLNRRIGDAQKKLETEASNLFEVEKKWSWLVDFRLEQPKRTSRTQQPIREKPAAASPAPFQFPRHSTGVKKVIPWSSSAPYWKTLLEATTYDALKIAYLKMLPHFYLHAAFHYDFAYALFNCSGPSDRLSFGRHVLSSILDLGIVTSPDLYRSMAFLLESNGMLDFALEIYDKVHSLCPQSATAKRDLALAMSKAGPRFYPRAISLLQSVISSPIDPTNDVNIVATMEWNALVAKAQRDGFQLPQVLDKRLESLKKDIQADIRICLAWDTSNRDIDLFVTEPDGFTVYHGEPESPNGGFLHQDAQTNGGPEQYLQAHAASGTYTLWTNLPSDANDHPLLGPTSLFLRVFFNWGRPSQREFLTFVRAMTTTKYLVLGEITIPEGATQMTGANFTSGGNMSPPRVAGVSSDLVPKAATSPRFSTAPRQMVQMKNSQVSVQASSTFDTPQSTSSPLLSKVDDFFSKLESSILPEEMPLPTGTLSVSSNMAPSSVSPIQSPRAPRPVSQRPPPLVPITAPSSPPQDATRPRSGIIRKTSQNVMTAAAAVLSGSPPKSSQSGSPESGLGGFGGLGGLGGSASPMGGLGGLSGTGSSGIGSAITSKTSPALARKVSGSVTPVTTPRQQESSQSTKAGGLGSVVSNSLAPQFGGMGGAVTSSSSSSSSHVSASPPTSPRSAGLIVDSEADAPRGVSGAAIQYAVESVALGIDPNSGERKQENCVTM